MSPAEVFEPFTAETLRRALGDAFIGRNIVVLQETTSTSEAILQLAVSGNEEGLVVFAEHQTAGRGQRGNRWESAAGKGLCFSILLYPQIALASSPRLTVWAVET